MCCGLWLSTVAGMTLAWWLINHDLVKGEVDQAEEGVRKKRKNGRKKREGENEAEVIIMSGFLLSLHPVIASSCQYFLGDSTLFKLKKV